MVVAHPQLHSAIDYLKSMKQRNGIIAVDVSRNLMLVKILTKLKSTLTSLNLNPRLKKNLSMLNIMERKNELIYFRGLNILISKRRFLLLPIQD